MSKSVLIIGGSSQIAQAIAYESIKAGVLVSIISRQTRPDNFSKNQLLHWFQDELQTQLSSQQQIELALEYQPDTIFICNGVLHDAKLRLCQKKHYCS